jgi:hypothetical protein
MTDFDAWDMAANDHLLAHVRGRLAANPMAYGRPASRLAMRRTTEPNADAREEFIAAITRLVQAKNTWAQEMRDMASDTGVPVDTQRRIWLELIAGTETESKPDAEDVPF